MQEKSLGETRTCEVDLSRHADHLPSHRGRRLCGHKITSHRDTCNSTLLCSKTSIDNAMPCRRTGYTTRTTYTHYYMQERTQNKKKQEETKIKTRNKKKRNKKTCVAYQPTTRQATRRDSCHESRKKKDKEEER